jgi:hypothetical protein
MRWAGATISIVAESSPSVIHEPDGEDAHREFGALP